VVEALAQAGKYEQAETLARSITDPDRQTDALARLAEALAKAEQYEQAEASARSITDPVRQADALAQVAEAVAEDREFVSANRATAAICAAGHWTIVMRPVLRQDSTAFTPLAHILEAGIDVIGRPSPSGESRHG